ncbi:MAG: UDP-N-acetylmuramoyl-L-alanine--D-glutamate ligase [Oscillospiraceae bacterium]|nr:UDP-N-acetylmuramoyl-L-alanine--D-glutamate ligase [Oscillospiraceae bacterium]
MGNLKGYINSLKGKRIAVIGAGVSNTPLIELLRDANVDVTVRDKNESTELSGVTLKLGEDYLEDLSEDIIFRTPGLMPSNPKIKSAVKNGSKLTSEMEVFFELCPCKIIAVTGSDGKTTTTSIIAELLKNSGKTVHLGGNIGTPLLYGVDSIAPDDIAVVELSSFQLITMTSSPDIAVVTNLSPNHLDIHGDLEEYIEAKRNIYKYQKSDDIAVFNLDNEVTKKYSETATAGDVRFFSRKKRVENGVYFEDGAIFSAKRGNSTELIKAEDIQLPGAHNIENYLAAFAAVRDMVGSEIMEKTAREFRGVAHRIELVREIGGVKFYNDSIASSPSRTAAGLKSFDKKVILIAGGKDKGVAFDELGALINKTVKKLILIGASAKLIETAVKSAKEYDAKLEIVMCDDLKKAVIAASKSAVSGDVVLLSPACTSFDMFKNFEERGNLFKSLVMEL